MNIAKKQARTYSPRGVAPKPVWVRLMPEELAEVERQAHENFRSVSAQVRMMVVEAIKEKNK